MLHQKNISCILQNAEVAHDLAHQISPKWLEKFEEIDIEDDGVEYLYELASTAPTAWHAGYLSALISISYQSPVGISGLIADTVSINRI